MNDVVLNKAASIERCLKRIREVYNHNPDNLNDFTKQDSIILNIQRACEQCIDIAMHIVSERKLGIPKSSREAFKLMQDAGILDEDLADRMMRMVGFRNTAVHAYQSLNLDILKTIIERHLDDFRRFTQTALKQQ
jgi:uncharacterized protein YutE (UPF0331/DUF86 family)